MSLLAKFIALSDEDNLVPSTDIERLHLTANNPDTNRHDEQCISYHLISALPAPRIDTPIEDIIRFKRRRRPELLAFRAELRHFEEKIRDAEGPTELKAIQSAFAERIEQRIYDLHMTTKESRIVCILSSLKGCLSIRPGSPLTVSLVGGYFSQLMGIPLTLPAAVGGITAAVVVTHETVSSWTKEKSFGRNSSFAYLYDARKVKIL